MSLIQYILTGCLLMALELLYLPVARRYRIGNHLSPQSSHMGFVITGGGFIFYAAALVFAVVNLDSLSVEWLIMLGGATALAVVSFCDDMREVASWLRLFLQAAVVAATFHALITPGAAAYFILVLVCGVGFINAYNFMDGINGMMVGYTLILSGALLYAYSLVPRPDALLPVQLTICLMIAAGVLAVFNWRGRAVCFSGDVGSITVGFLMLFLMVHWMLVARDASLIALVLVYGVDTSLTIIQRLFIGENIFTPHRRHAYQLLTNQWGRSHWSIALAYAGVQGVVDVVYFLMPDDLHWAYVIVVTMLLAGAYFTVKRHPLSRQR